MDFEVFDGENSPIQLHADVSERERRRYVQMFGAVAEAAQKASEGYEARNDTQALAGSIAVGMLWQQFAEEVHEVIEEALGNAARSFAEAAQGLMPDAGELPEIPDTADELLDQIGGNDDEEG